MIKKTYFKFRSVFLYKYQKISIQCFKWKHAQNTETISIDGKKKFVSCGVVEWMNEWMKKGKTTTTTTAQKKHDNVESGEKKEARSKTKRRREKNESLARFRSIHMTLQIKHGCFLFLAFARLSFCSAKITCTHTTTETESAKGLAQKRAMRGSVEEKKDKLKF